MNYPLISVAMGIYNCADTLENAVRCIQEQTYPNWELILCDDASTDSTFEIAYTLSSQDSRIHLLRNDRNLTLAPTLNRCIRQAKGEYIARMDGDDICEATRFEKEIEILQKEPSIAVVSCQMNLFDKAGVFRTVEYPQNPTSHDLCKKTQFCHAGCMIRTSVLKALGGYSENKYCARVEDYDLWVRLYAAGYHGYNIQEPLYSMRDDRDAVRRRSFRARCNESRVIVRACKAANTFPFEYLRGLKPIVKGFVPTPIYRIIHRNKQS